MKLPYKKFISLVMAFWSILVYSGAFPHGVELFLSPVKIVNESFPCATHSCGCKTAIDCETDCCCYPKQPPKIEKSCCDSEKVIEVPVSFFVEASCKGNDESSKGISLFQVKAVENDEYFNRPQKKGSYEWDLQIFVQKEYQKRIPSPG